MSAGFDTVFPIVIVEWRRNQHEIVRIALDKFNGRNTIDVRCWYQASEAAWRPSRSGLTISVAHLERLANGFDHALQRARALRLVESDTTNTKDRTATERQRRYRERHRNSGVTK